VIGFADLTRKSFAGSIPRPSGSEIINFILYFGALLRGGSLIAHSTKTIKFAKEVNEGLNYVKPLRKQPSKYCILNDPGEL